MNTRGKVWFQAAPLVWAVLLFGTILAIAFLTGQLRPVTAASLGSLQLPPASGTLDEQEKVTAETQTSGFISTWITAKPAAARRARR